MSKIAVISKEQHREIYGKPYTDSMNFNPVLDRDGNIIITEEEVTQLQNQDFIWAAYLELKNPEEILVDRTPEEWLQADKQEAEATAAAISKRLDNGAIEILNTKPIKA